MSCKIEHNIEVCMYWGKIFLCFTVFNCFISVSIMPDFLSTYLFIFRPGPVSS